MEFGASFNPLAAIILPPTLAAFELIIDIFGIEALILWPTL